MKKTWLIGLVLLIAGSIASCQKSPSSTPSASYPSPTVPMSGSRVSASPSAMKSSQARPPAAYPPPVSRTALQPGSASPSGTPTPPPNFPGKLAFHSKRSGVLQIYVLHGNSGKIDPLTSGTRQSFEPNWSPDCQSLVYTSGNGGNDDFEIYTMQADGQNARKVLSHPIVDDWSPMWSPQGDTIAYVNNAKGRLNVCFVSIEGEQKGCLPRGEYDNAFPAWSPDGSKILFASDRDGHWNLYLATVGQESRPVQLSKNTYKNIQPSFSPDGRSIAFASKRMENYDIFVINADGSHERQLTTDPADDVTPRWVGSDQIVFASLRSRNWDLFLMKANGKDVRRLTRSDGMDKWPEWCPKD